MGVGKQKEIQYLCGLSECNEVFIFKAQVIGWIGTFMGYIKDILVLLLWKGQKIMELKSCSNRKKTLDTL